MLLLSTYGFSKPFDVMLSSQTLQMGDTLFLKIIADSELTSYKCNFVGRKCSLFLESKSDSQVVYVAYLGASRFKSSGEYVFILSLKSAKGSTFYEHFSITLNHPPKKKGKVNLSNKSKKISQDTSSRKQELQAISKAFNVKTSRRYFTGDFLEPAQGRISSTFGKVRYYNNGNVSSHSGVDFSNKIGTKVSAIQAGKVLLAEPYKIHGNTVMIDHGFGVISIYCHLNTVLVKPNDSVRGGDEIGKMGATGIVSGPHLHLGLSVQGVRVDPMFWINRRINVLDF